MNLKVTYRFSFGEKQVLIGTFWETLHIHMKMFPETSIEPIYGALTWKPKIMPMD